MRNDHEEIHLETAHGPAVVTVGQAVALLGVHEKTALRWARGQQTPSRERVALLAILSGQVVPFPGWDGWRFVARRGPAPTRRRYAVLQGPNGQTWRPDY